jgi:hypothetical protein
MGEYRAHRDVVAWGLAVAFGVAAIVLTAARLHWWAALVGPVVAALVLGTVAGVSRLTLSQSAQAQLLMRRAHELARAMDDERTKPLLKAVDEHLALVARSDSRRHGDLIKRLVGDLSKAVDLLAEGPGPDFAEDLRTRCRNMARTVEHAAEVLDRRPPGRQSQAR